MLKRRIAAVEKRLTGLGEPTEMPRLVFRFACDPEPEDGKPVWRFNFGDSGQAGRLNEKTNDMVDISHPTEREKTQV